MKKIFIYIACLLMTVAFIMLPLICFAGESNDINKPISVPKFNISEVIKEKVTEERVKERYEMSKTFEPDVYTYDLNNYLLEYNVSTDYWNGVSTNDYKGLISQIDYNYPSIYIPIFANIKDTKGVEHNRVIGNIILKYNILKNDYIFSMMIYNLNNSDYLDEKSIGTYEKIKKYIDNSESKIEQIFLIRYPSSLSDDDEKIAVIKMQSDLKILDVSNSLKINENDLIKNEYTVEEYKSIRKEIEKDLYKNIDINEKNPAGVIFNLNNDNYNYKETFIFIFISIIILVSIGIFIVRKKRINSKNM